MNYYLYHYQGHQTASLNAIVAKKRTQKLLITLKKIVHQKQTMTTTKTTTTIITMTKIKMMMNIVLIMIKIINTT